ncbi:hypothetical protein M5689_013114 [Euphorbia peplus]|nr:hypothetical protein M5689_013114 [Euphorbia peplus]
MVVITLPIVELLREIFAVMRFPAFTETLRVENCEEQYYCCIHLPTLSNNGCDYPSIDFYGHSSRDYAEARNLAASAALTYLLPLHDFEINDFSSAEIADLELEKHNIDIAEIEGYAAMTSLNHKFVKLKDLFVSVVAIVRGINGFFTDVETPNA